MPASWRDDLAETFVLGGPQWAAISDHNPVVAVLEPAIGTSPVVPPNLGLQGTPGDP